jgi:hypothetical protein
MGDIYGFDGKKPVVTDAPLVDVARDDPEEVRVTRS